jgi:hypothetical protein
MKDADFRRRDNDILDRLHNKARQGASLRRMCEVFPELNPEMVEYWYRNNGFMINEQKRIQQADKARRLRAKRRTLRERRLRNAIFS